MKKIVVISVLALLVYLCIIYQSHNQYLLRQTVDDWRTRVALANLLGKSPQKVAMFLDQRGVPHDKYCYAKWIDNHNNFRGYLGSIGGDVGPVARTFSFDAMQVWYVGIIFEFDGQNRCTGTLITWHPKR